MKRRTALQLVGASAIGSVGLGATADTAAAAERPSFQGLTRDTTFETNPLGGAQEATRVDTSRVFPILDARGAIKYPVTKDTTVEFVGFDRTPSDVDVALVEFTRGTQTSTDSQTVSFKASFQYESTDGLDDFFVDIIGDTLID